MSATSEALNRQGNLLSKFMDVVLGLIKNPAADKREIEQAKAKIAEFTAADEANAAFIEANNVKLSELLEAAAAAILPIETVNSTPDDDVEDELE